jgi:hypothetical protein
MDAAKSPEEREKLGKTVTELQQQYQTAGEGQREVIYLREKLKHLDTMVMSSLPYANQNYECVLEQMVQNEKNNEQQMGQGGRMDPYHAASKASSGINPFNRLKNVFEGAVSSVTNPFSTN